jgi:hypothetical protein
VGFINPHSFNPLRVLSESGKSLKEFTFDASIWWSKRKRQLYNTVNASWSLKWVNTQHAQKEHEIRTKLAVKHQQEQDHLKNLSLDGMIIVKYANNIKIYVKETCWVNVLRGRSQMTNFMITAKNSWAWQEVLSSDGQELTSGERLCLVWGMMCYSTWVSEPGTSPLSSWCEYLEIMSLETAHMAIPILTNSIIINSICVSLSQIKISRRPWNKCGTNYLFIYLLYIP